MPSPHFYSCSVGPAAVAFGVGSRPRACSQPHQQFIIVFAAAGPLVWTTPQSISAPSVSSLKQLWRQFCTRGALFFRARSTYEGCFEYRLSQAIGRLAEGRVTSSSISPKQWIIFESEAVNRELSCLSSITEKWHFFQSIGEQSASQK